MCVNCGCDPCGCRNLTIPRGARGAAAAGWRSGSGAPVFVVGDLVNALYLDIDNGHVWSFNGTTWSDTGLVLIGSDNLLFKYNARTPVTTTGTISEVLQSFTLPAALATPNFSQIIIEAYYNVTLNNNLKQGQLFINGNPISSFQLQGGTRKAARLRNTLSRITATTVRSEFDVQYMDLFGVVNEHRHPYSNTVFNVQNLDTLTNAIEAKGISFATGDITCEFLTVEIKPLV